MIIVARVRVFRIRGFALTTMWNQNKGRIQKMCKHMTAVEEAASVVWCIRLHVDLKCKVAILILPAEISLTTNKVVNLSVMIGRSIAHTRLPETQIQGSWMPTAYSKRQATESRRQGRKHLLTFIRGTSHLSNKVIRCRSNAFPLHISSKCVHARNIIRENGIAKRKVKKTRHPKT